MRLYIIFIARDESEYIKVELKQPATSTHTYILAINSK